MNNGFCIAGKHIIVGDIVYFKNGQAEDGFYKLTKYSSKKFTLTKTHHIEDNAAIMHVFDYSDQDTLWKMIKGHDKITFTKAKDPVVMRIILNHNDVYTF